MDCLNFDIGISLLSEYDENGFLGIQIDAYGEGKAGVQAYESHGVGGFLYRPCDPELDSDGNPVPSTAAQVLYALEGGRGHAWCLNDPKSVARLPRLKKSGSIQFGNRGYSFHVINGETGSHFIYVPYGFDAKGENPTKSCSITVNVDDPSSPFLSFVLGDGTALTLQDGTATIKSASGKSWVAVSDDGTDVSGGLNVRGGVSVGDESALSVALYEPLAAYLQALEAAVIKGNAAGPIPIGVPFSTVMAAIKSRLLKAS
jgi:hypothetical protein